MSDAPKIVIDGKEYEGLEQLPEELKRALKDQDGNGIPDLFEGKFSFSDIKNLMSYAWKNPGALQVKVQGQTVTNLDQLPPEAKAKMQAAMQRLKISSPAAAPAAPSASPRNLHAMGAPGQKSGGAWALLMIVIGLLLSLAIAGWFVVSYLSSK